MLDFSPKSMRYILSFGLFLMWFGISFAQVRRVDDAALKNAAKLTSDGDWLAYGLTPGETRFSPLKQIDASNVMRLGLVWAYLHHFCAGIRYLLLDLHIGTELTPLRQSSYAVLIVSLALTAVVGARLW